MAFSKIFTQFIMLSALLPTAAAFVHADPMRAEQTLPGPYLISRPLFSEVTDHPELGIKVLRAPSHGLIWGDVVTKNERSALYCPTADDQQPCEMLQRQAQQYCTSIGARLPEVAEFAQLGVYLGASRLHLPAANSLQITDTPDHNAYFYHALGFTPRILPNLDNHVFWISTLNHEVAPEGYQGSAAQTFNGSTGEIHFEGWLENQRQPKFVRCVLGEMSAPTQLRIQTTQPGRARFTRVTDHPELGTEVWRAPNRLIWGDLVMSDTRSARNCPSTAPGDVCYMAEAGAKNYCQSIGAHLPTQADFAQLGIYLGATQRAEQDHEYSLSAIRDRRGNTYFYDSHGYLPQVLPHLHQYGFWTSTPSVTQGQSSYYHVFSGYSGLVGDLWPSEDVTRGAINYRSNLFAVRCVK